MKYNDKLSTGAENYFSTSIVAKECVRKAVDMTRVSMTKTVLPVLVGMLLMMPPLWAGNTQENLILPKTSVYLTKDISPKGLKKLYRKLAPALAGKPYIHEYAADSFLINGDESILVYDKESSNALLPDIPRSLAQVLGVDSNLHYRANTDKNSPVAHWHNFRFWPCLCYDEDWRENMPDKQCQSQPWYPSAVCRLALKSLKQYKQNLMNKEVVVVLSKFKAHSGGAVENMLAGNMPVNIASARPDKGHHILPLADFWARRIANPNKQTLFITVLTDIEDAAGQKHNLGMIGSGSFIAAQKAAFELVHQINPTVKWEEPTTETTNYEQAGAQLLQVLIENRIPEAIHDKYPNSNRYKRLAKTTQMRQQRNNDSYKIVPLEK